MKQPGFSGKYEFLFVADMTCREEFQAHKASFSENMD